jgi:Periplasmic binding protein
MSARTSIWAGAAALVTMLGSMLAVSPGEAGASSPADQGVTAKTISVGLPYVNFEALKSLGVTINDGSFPDAYNAVIAAINAQGGVNGRKLVLHTAEMNPAVPAEATSSCTQLTEDDKVFVAIAPVFPDCYQQTHGTPVIAGSLPGSLPANAAPDFALIPPDANFDPIQLAAFKNAGDFKGKKVAIFYGADSDAPEVKVVQNDLKKLGIPVALTAEDSVQATDAVASDQEVQSISQRFQSAGVNMVIGVGGAGSTTWPRAQLDNQSTYKPTYIATSESSLISYVESTKGANPYLKYVLSASSGPSFYQQWKDPAIKKCAAEVHKAYPSDTITPPVDPTSPGAGNSTDTTYASVVEACQYMGLFDAIAAKAGKNLTVASFTKAGYALKNADIPGLGAISFGPGQAYATGPVTIYKYDPTSETLVPASSSGTQ